MSYGVKENNANTQSPLISPDWFDFSDTLLANQSRTRVENCHWNGKFNFNFVDFYLDAIRNATFFACVPISKIIQGFSAMVLVFAHNYVATLSGCNKWARWNVLIRVKSISFHGRSEYDTFTYRQMITTIRDVPCFALMSKNAIAWIIRWQYVQQQIFNHFSFPSFDASCFQLDHPYLSTESMLAHDIIY